MVENISEMEEYIKKFKKKFSGFRSRAPIYFTYQVTPLKVFVQFEEEIDIKEFDIDYNLPVEDTIHKIREWFRNYKYPKIIHSKRVKIEPDISDINNLMIKENATFEEAFSSLSSKTKKEILVIDKVDISKDRIIVLDDKKDTIMYQVDIPVLAFVKSIKSLPENSRWKEFEKHCKKVEKER